MSPRIQDQTVREKTGRGWDGWFELLDGEGASARDHKQIAASLVERHGVGGWWAQSVTVEYEKARGMRAERAPGFSATATRTVAAPVERVYAAFADDEERARWLSEPLLEVRKASPPRTISFDVADGDTRLHVRVSEKGEGRSHADLYHDRLADAAEAERMKSLWRGRLTQLKELLER